VNEGLSKFTTLASRGHGSGMISVATSNVSVSGVPSCQLGSAGTLRHVARTAAEKRFAVSPKMACVFGTAA
jgi:hypothetical protein